MAKDPAFLFYPGDWQGGTITMSRFLKGCYMDLLVAQFNSGPLSLEEIRTVLGSDFGQSWPSLRKKFKESEGLFFNERLEVEKTKRAAYSESRKNNRKKHVNNHMEQHMSNHMIEHMENENGDEEVDDFGKCENLLSIPLDAKTLEAAEMNQFQFTKDRNTDFVKTQFEIFKRERVHDPPVKQKEYIKYNARMYSHFLNWIRNKFPKHEANLKPVTGNKQRGAYELLEKTRAEHEQRRAAGNAG